MLIRLFQLLHEMDLLASYSSDSDEFVVDEEDQNSNRAVASSVPVPNPCTGSLLPPAKKKARLGEQAAAASSGICLAGQLGCGDLSKGHVRELQPPSAFGRVRKFPHVEGNFATVVYIPVTEALNVRLHALLHDFLAKHNSDPAGGNKHAPSSQQKLYPVCPCCTCTAGGSNNSSQHVGPHSNTLTAAASTATGQHTQQCNPSQEVQHQLPLHMSLSRTVAIRHSQIDSLRAALSNELRPFKSFTVQLAGLTCLVNDNQSRSFVGIKTAAVRQLLRMLGAVDKAFQKHGLPPFHKDPIPHVSLAWAAGNQSSRLQPWLDACEHETLALKVTQIICQTGKARHVVWQG